MTKVPYLQRWWVQTLISGGAGIFVPVVTDWLKWTQSLKESVAVFIGTWAIGMIFQIAHSLQSFHVSRLEAQYLREVINSVDFVLLELQSRFREIASRTLSGRPNRVFIDYCRRSLEHGLDVARRAAQRGELEVRDHHFETIETVLAAFEGCQDRTFRCVWQIGIDDELFDESWRQYMMSLVRLSRERLTARRVRVKILFVQDDQACLDRPSVKTLFAFVSAEKGFECCLMSRKDYEMRLRDGGLNEKHPDFGVYGDHLLFITTGYDPNVGVFIDNQAVIKKYSKMHDFAMEAVQASKISSSLAETPTLAQFLNCDGADVVSEANAQDEVEQ